MKVITNNHAYPILQYWDLTEVELAEFDNLGEEALESDSFIRYKGNIYSLNEFCSTNIDGYDGYCYHTAFNGVLIKFVDSDYVKMASYYS